MPINLGFRGSSYRNQNHCSEASRARAYLASRSLLFYAFSYTRRSTPSHWWRKINHCSWYDQSSPCGVGESDSPSGASFSRSELNISRQRVSLYRWVLRLSNTLLQTAWATVMHKSYEGGDGMKLRDLARSSGDPKSFMPAFHLLRSRFGSRRTSRGSRKSYESVPVTSSALRILTLLQQTTVVVVLGILRRPCHPGTDVKFPIRAYHRDRCFRKRTCNRPSFFPCFLIPEQNQRKTYREVLIAGDLSQEDISQATIQLVEFEVSQAVNGFASVLTPYQELHPNVVLAPIWQKRV